MSLYVKIKVNFLVNLLIVLFLFNGCSQKQLSTSKPLDAIDKTQTIALYGLDNFTETPRAGLRAANIIEGVLISKGYKVDNRIEDETHNLTKAQKISDALSRNNRYLLIGGVSEWRYKTGIDGEPAVSLQFSLIDLETNKIIWSAVASDSSWGHASIGTMSQELITSMINGGEK